MELQDALSQILSEAVSSLVTIESIIHERMLNFGYFLVKEDERGSFSYDEWMMPYGSIKKSKQNQIV